MGYVNDDRKAEVRNKLLSNLLSKITALGTGATDDDKSKVYEKWMQDYEKALSLGGREDYKLTPTDVNDPDHDAIEIANILEHGYLNDYERDGQGNAKFNTDVNGAFTGFSTSDPNNTALTPRKTRSVYENPFDSDFNFSEIAGENNTTYSIPFAVDVNDKLRYHGNKSYTTTDQDGNEITIDPTTGNKTVTRPDGITYTVDKDGKLVGEPTYNSPKAAEGTYAYDPLHPTETPVTDPKVSGWTDWAPLTAERINDQLAFKRLDRLNNLRKTVLNTAKTKLASTNSDYLQLQIYEKQKALLRSQAALYGSSDLEKMMAYQDAAEKLISSISDRLAELKSQTNATNKQAITEAANYNLQNQTDTGNENMKKLAALNESKLASKKTSILLNIQSLNSYITNMTQDYGKYILTVKSDMKDAKIGEIGMQYQIDTDKLTKDYENKWTYPWQWDGFDRFLEEKLHDNTDNMLPTECKDCNLGELTSATRETIANSAELLKCVSAMWAESLNYKYRRDWENALKVAKELHDRDLTNLQIKYNSQVLNIGTPTNQGDWFNFLAPRADQSGRKSSIYKSGGSIQKELLKNQREAMKIEAKNRLIEAKLKQQQDESVRKHNEAILKQMNATIDKQLERIDKELLILLKAIFK